MKTNRFEEILRRKLEGIQPDFQDQDWDNWQAFKQQQTPSFWQTYGHWMGYAVATLTTAVMVVLYSQQASQNEALRKEMEGLKQQLEAQVGSMDSVDSAIAREIPIRDTVYIIERQTVYREVPRSEANLSEEQPTTDLPAVDEQVLSEKSDPISPALPKPSRPVNDASLPATKPERRVAEQGEKNLPQQKTVPESSNGAKENQLSDNLIAKPRTITETTNRDGRSTRTEPTGQEIQTTAPSPQQESAAAGERVVLGELVAPAPQEFSNSRNYLYRRLQARMPRHPVSQPMTPSSLQQDESDRSNKVVAQKAKKEKIANETELSPQPDAEKKVNEVKKEENLLPNFGLGLPYRVGVSQQWAGDTRAFSVWNEFLLGKHWAVQAGLSWNKLEPQKFFNEKMFSDDMREDIRKEHAGKLPPSFEIFNINIKTTLLQIPLGVSYRGEMGNGFTYFVQAGTNLNVQAKQLLTFDFRRPSKDYGQQSTERYAEIPVINNARFGAGIEKRWSPIVLQAGSFVETHLQTLPFLRDRTDVGFQVKILYEIGKGKKN